MFDSLHSGAAVDQTASSAHHDGVPWWVDDPWDDVPDDTTVIPPDLDALPPGPILGVLLSGLDLSRLDGHDRLVVLRAHHRQAAHHRALAFRAMTAVVAAIDAENDFADTYPEEAAAAEIGAALTLTRRSADYELSLALGLHRRLPRVAAALEAGRIDERKARVLVDATSHLSVALARDVADRLVEEAPDLTTGQLRSRLRRACIEMAPEEATARYQSGVGDRRVVTQPATDGTGSLFAYGLEPHRLAAAMRRVNRIAKSLRSRHEIRTMDQLRADAFLDLLTGTAPPGDAAAEPRGTVDIRVGLTTLIGLDENPAELGGFGPIVADVARSVLSAHADLQRSTTVVADATDATPGHPCRCASMSPDDIAHLRVDARRPTAVQRRMVEAMYPTCVWPGCRMPARESDLDHTRPRSDGGPTTTDNLAPLCRYHHRIRHRWGWSYRRLTDGSHEFTSPLGRVYRVNRDPP